MSPEQTIICNMERAFPILIVGGLLYGIARKLHLPRVAQLLARLGLGLPVVLVAVAMLGGVHHVPVDARAFFVGWLLLGLPIYLVKRWLDGADARAAHHDALRQARGHQRRRASPPIGAAPTQTKPAPTQTPGGTP